MSASIVSLVFLLFAVPITLFDIAELRIPDALTFGGMALFVAVRIALRMDPPYIVLVDGAIGFAVLWLVRLCTGGRLGLGDAKYSAFIAVAFGAFAWLVALLIASIAGLAFAGVSILMSKAKRSERLPFAPFLTLGAACAAVAQGPIKAILVEGAAM